MLNLYKAKPSKFNKKFFKKNTTIYKPDLNELKKLNPKSIAYQIGWKFAMKRNSQSVNSLVRSVRFNEEVTPKEKEKSWDNSIEKNSAERMNSQERKDKRKAKSNLIQITIKKEAESYKKRQKAFQNVMKEKALQKGSIKVK